MLETFCGLPLPIGRRPDTSICIVQCLLGSDPVYLSPTFISPTALPKQITWFPNYTQPFLKPSFHWEIPSALPTEATQELPKCHHFPETFLQQSLSWKSPLPLSSPWCRLSPLRLYVNCFGPISSSCWFAINVVICESPATDTGLAPVTVQWGPMERINGQAPVIEAASLYWLRRASILLWSREGCGAVLLWTGRFPTGT